MTEPNQVDRDAEPSELHSDAWRLQAIFFEPGRTFEEIRQRPNWVLPLIALLLLGFLSFNYLVSRVGWDSIIRQQVSQSPQFQDASSEQKEQILQRTKDSGFFQIFFRIAPLFAVIVVLIPAGLFFGILLLAGKEARFKRVFSVVCHSYYAVGLVSSILLVVVVALAEDPASLDLQNPLQTNLGFLADSASRALGFFLSSIDLFTMYRIALLAMGLSAITRKLSVGGGVAIVGGCWLIYVLVVTVFTYAFAG